MATDPPPPSEKPPLTPAQQSRLEESRMWDAVAYLLAGQIGFGGAGFVIDKVFTTGWVTLVGMLTGMAVSLYVVWFRYGTSR
ncbi:MAG: hypothetical protein WAW82_08810 [Candidatus Lutibacillus vidarii]